MRINSDSGIRGGADRRGPGSLSRGTRLWYGDHRFYADGEEIRLPVSSEGDYAVQNGLQEGYLYDLTLKNSEVISAVSPKADGEGKTTAAGENHVTVGGKAFSFTEIYEISN